MIHKKHTNVSIQTLLFQLRIIHAHQLIKPTIYNKSKKYRYQAVKQKEQSKLKRQKKRLQH